MAFATKEIEINDKKFTIRKFSLKFGCDLMDYASMGKIPHEMKVEAIKTYVTLTSNEAGVPQKLDDVFINENFTPYTFQYMFKALYDFNFEDDLKKNVKYLRGTANQSEQA
jgi:hypothetical protein